MLRNVASGRFRLVVSTEILEDFRFTLSRRSVLQLLVRRNLSDAFLQRVIDALTEEADVVQLTGQAPECRDEDDRIYLHTALVGSADFLVTRDRDLLVVGRIGECQIVDPGALLDIMRAEGDDPDP